MVVRVGDGESSARWRASEQGSLPDCRPLTWNRGRAQPIVTLVIGLALFPIFFWWESRVDQRIALIPSSIWFIRNVTILIVVSLTPYFW
jgi:hypothetical protein